MGGRDFSITGCRRLFCSIKNLAESKRGRERAAYSQKFNESACAFRLNDFCPYSNFMKPMCLQRGDNGAISGQVSYRELCGPRNYFHMMTEIEYSWSRLSQRTSIRGYALCSCIIQLRNKGRVSWHIKILGFDKGE